MNQGLIPSRYAKALFEYAQANQADTAMYHTMQRLAASFASEPTLASVMANPFVKADDKVKLLNTAAGVNDNDPVYERFLALLAQNNRLDMARDIALAYAKTYRREHHVRLVKVVSAAPMNPADEDRLKALIQHHLGTDTMEYLHTVDPELIGGFTVAIDNEKLDASIANELKQLRLKLVK